MSISKKDVLVLARIKLPLAVEVLTKANLEAQKTNPNLQVLSELFYHDDLDGFYDVVDSVQSYLKIERLLDKKDRV